MRSTTVLPSCSEPYKSFNELSLANRTRGEENRIALNTVHERGSPYKLVEELVKIAKH